MFVGMWDNIVESRGILRDINEFGVLKILKEILKFLKRLIV